MDWRATLAKTLQLNVVKLMGITQYCEEISFNTEGSIKSAGKLQSIQYTVVFTGVIYMVDMQP